MKKMLSAFLLVFLLSTSVWADGVFEEPLPKPVRQSRKVHRAPQRIVRAPELIPPPPSCVPSSRRPKVKIVSWEPEQKVEKFLGEITECQTTQWDVLKILAGPNIIGLDYPSEKEMWGYLGMWSYELQNPLGETLILMDRPGRRLQRYKKPVDLRIVFNEQDMVEKIEMDLIKNTKK